MQEISKEELAKEVEETEATRKYVIDEYLANIGDFETEVMMLLKLAKKVKLFKAGALLSFYMIDLHTTIAKETGQMVTRDDTGPVPEF